MGFRSLRGRTTPGCGLPLSLAGPGLSVARARPADRVSGLPPPRGSDYAYRRAPRGYEDRGFLARAEDELASWFGDDAARQRREVDHRGRRPKTYVRSDMRIEEDVNDRLTDDRDVDATEVSVGVKDREVTLDGTVDTRRAKRAAEDCAGSVSGVVHVQNNLRAGSAAS